MRILCGILSWPSSTSLKGKNIISIPIRDAKKELTVTKNLFADANFVTIDASEHDKKMATILGLTHMVNLIFASIISKDDKAGLTEKMAGSTFKAQKILAEGIMSESPQLIEAIISNPELRRIAEGYKDRRDCNLHQCMQGTFEYKFKCCNI